MQRQNSSLRLNSLKEVKPQFSDFHSTFNNIVLFNGLIISSVTFNSRLVRKEINYRSHGIHPTGNWGYQLSQPRPY